MTYQKNGDYLIPEIQMDEQPGGNSNQVRINEKKISGRE